MAERPDTSAPQRPAAAQRVSSNPPDSPNQAGTQPMPTAGHEGAPSSGSTGRGDPQSPSRASASGASAGSPAVRAPGALPVTEAGPVPEGSALAVGASAEDSGPQPPAAAPTGSSESLMRRPAEVQVPSTATTPVPVEGSHQVPDSGAASMARRPSAPDGEVAPE